jgi:hypothetical protein
MIGILLGSATGLVAGNFIYQLTCIHPDWSVAVERSAFQLFAVLTVGAGVAIRSAMQ